MARFTGPRPAAPARPRPAPPECAAQSDVRGPSPSQLPNAPSDSVWGHCCQLLPVEAGFPTAIRAAIGLRSGNSGPLSLFRDDSLSFCHRCHERDQRTQLGLLEGIIGLAIKDL